MDQATATRYALIRNVDAELAWQREFARMATAASSWQDAADAAAECAALEALRAHLTAGARFPGSLFTTARDVLERVGAVGAGPACCATAEKIAAFGHPLEV